MSCVCYSPRSSSRGTLWPTDQITMAKKQSVQEFLSFYGDIKENIKRGNQESARRDLYATENSETQAFSRRSSPKNCFWERKLQVSKKRKNLEKDMFFLWYFFFFVLEKKIHKRKIPHRVLQRSEKLNYCSANVFIKLKPQL